MFSLSYSHSGQYVPIFRIRISKSGRDQRVPGLKRGLARRVSLRVSDHVPPSSAAVSKCGDCPGAAKHPSILNRGSVPIYILLLRSSSFAFYRTSDDTPYLIYLMLIFFPLCSINRGGFHSAPEIISHCQSARFSFHMANQENPGAKFGAIKPERNKGTRLHRVVIKVAFGEKGSSLV